MSLTLYNIMAPLTTPIPSRDKHFEILWEKDKMPVTSIFSFFHNIFHCIKDKLNTLITFHLSSANSSNLDKTNFLSSGKGLTKMLNSDTNFQNIRSCFYNGDTAAFSDTLVYCSFGILCYPLWAVTEPTKSIVWIKNDLSFLFFCLVCVEFAFIMELFLVGLMTNLFFVSSNGIYSHLLKINLFLYREI